MTATILDILAAILGVVIAPLCVIGIIKPKTRIGDAARVGAGISVVLLFLTVWGNTGRDPLQWSYCFVVRSAQSCRDIKWGVWAAPAPRAQANESSSHKIALPMRPEPTDNSSSAVDMKVALRVEASARLPSVIWKPATSLTVFLDQLSVNKLLALDQPPPFQTSDGQVADVLERAVRAARSSQTLLNSAVENAKRGWNASQAAKSGPKVYVGYEYGTDGRYRGELDPGGIPKGFGTIGRVVGSSYSLAMGNFTAGKAHGGGYYVFPRGPYLMMGNPSESDLSIGFQPDRLGRGDGSLIVAGKDANCVGTYKFSKYDRATGLGICRFNDGTLYIGELEAQQLGGIPCKFDVKYCYKILKRGLGALYDFDKKLLKSGSWSDPRTQ